ncbi:MAG: hypothetical protein IT355_12425 [Gemmatimonadaceae bacterium]|nr:hypothetical protein [Gemmatimonadaceae bacterium]
MTPSATTTAHVRALRQRACGIAVAALALTLARAGALPAQPAPRQVRVEVRDRDGRMLPGVRVDFLPRGDSTSTDSSGVALAEVEADSTLTISVRKIGFEPRAARFPVGSAPAFLVRVTLGQLGVRLPEVSVVAEYPGEPWRRAYEERKHRASGSFRDRSFFTGRPPMVLDDWFNGMPGVQMTARGLRINRCPRLGVWIDGMHVTGPGLSSSLALMQLTATDIAAVELYRMSQQQSQYSDPAKEDCSLLVWTRSR